MNNKELKELKQEILLELLVCNDTRKLRNVQKVLREPSTEPRDVITQGYLRGEVYEGFGEHHTNAEWARRLGLSRQAMWRGLQKGLTVEQVAEKRGIKYPQE